MKGTERRVGAGKNDRCVPIGRYRVPKSSLVGLDVSYTPAKLCRNIQEEHPSILALEHNPLPVEEQPSPAPASPPGSQTPPTAPRPTLSRPPPHSPVLAETQRVGCHRGNGVLDQAGPLARWGAGHLYCPRRGSRRRAGIDIQAGTRTTGLASEAYQPCTMGICMRQRQTRAIAKTKLT